MWGLVVGSGFVVSGPTPTEAIKALVPGGRVKSGMLVMVLLAWNQRWCTCTVATVYTTVSQTV